MRYFGSKISVTSDIVSAIDALGNYRTVSDPFGGLGTVGAALRQRAYEVATGDQLLFAHCFQVARLEMDGHPGFSSLRRRYGGGFDVAEHLNNLRCTDGWVTREYAVKRGFFTRANAQRVDAMWNQIFSWRDLTLTTRVEHALLVASLVDSADAVANTAGTYHAHLKQFAPRTEKALVLKLLDPVRGPRGRARLGEATRTATIAASEVLYLDPPYNRRNYGGYYHLPESLARGGKPALRGAAGLPDRPFPMSAWYVRKQAPAALEALVKTAPWQALVLHYSDAGYVPPETVRAILKPLGRLKEETLNARGFSTTGSRRTQHRLYMVVRP